MLRKFTEDFSIIEQIRSVQSRTNQGWSRYAISSPLLSVQQMLLQIRLVLPGRPCYQAGEIPWVRITVIPVSRQNP